MFEFLELSDGTTTLELTDLQNYALVSYAPQIGTLRDNELGGRGPYQDANETLIVHAMGETAALAYAAADALNRLFDTARRWWLQENATPVILRMKAQGSSLAPLRAIVLGRPLGGPRPITLPPQFNESYCRYIIANLQLQFTRGGQLLAGSADTASSANATHPTVHTCTFSTSAPTQSPIDLSLSGATAASVFNYQTGYCLIGPSARLNLTEGEVTPFSTVGTGLASSSTVADAAFLASAGSVRRWAGTTTFTGQINNRVTLTVGMAASRQPIAVFAAVRFNSASIVTGVWRAQAVINGSVVDQTPDLPIAYAAGKPQIIALGLLQSRAGMDTINLQFDGVLPIGLTFDIDYIASIALDDEASRVIALADFVTGRLSLIAGATAIALEIRANALTDSAPAVRVTSALGDVNYFGYGGDPYLVQSGSDVSMILLSTGAGNAWRPATTGAGAAISGVLTASRRLAYLVPQ
jgi:hypothetical protein